VARNISHEKPQMLRRSLHEVEEVASDLLRALVGERELVALRSRRALRQEALDALLGGSRPFSSEAFA
jgi:hypothetical protein